MGYDFEAATLQLEFRDGYIYQYFLLPEELYRRLMSAPSKGAFFTKTSRTDSPLDWSAK